MPSFCTTHWSDTGPDPDRANYFRSGSATLNLLRILSQDYMKVTLSIAMPSSTILNWFEVNFFFFFFIGVILLFSFHSKYVQCTVHYEN